MKLRGRALQRVEDALCVAIAEEEYMIATYSDKDKHADELERHRARLAELGKLHTKVLRAVVKENAEAESIAAMSAEPRDGLMALEELLHKLFGEQQGAALSDEQIALDAGNAPIGYINERGEPVLKQMSQHDIDICECGGLTLLYGVKPTPEPYSPYDFTLLVAKNTQLRQEVEMLRAENLRLHSEQHVADLVKDAIEAPPLTEAERDVIAKRRDAAISACALMIAGTNCMIVPKADWVAAIEARIRCMLAEMERIDRAGDKT